MSSDAPAPTRVETGTAAAIALLASALGSLTLRQDRSVDLFHYHIYNGYALLAGRLDRDIAPAGVVTYFNPLLDAAYYAGIRHLPPRVFGALLGALQGLNVFLVWAVARRTLGRPGWWLAPLAALLAGLGQDAVSLLGTTLGDNTVSILALAALLLTLGADSPGVARALAAGLVGGAAVGLKPTTAAPHLGLAALVIWTACRRRRARPPIAFALGTLAGWGVTNGWWAVAVCRRFGNPLYPLFNNLFNSPFSPPVFRLDPRWGVREPLDWLRPPVDAALGFHSRLQEAPFRDARLLLVFLALLVWLVASWRNARSGPASPLPGLVLYWLVTYVTWLGAFHYYRYGAVLEFLAPAVAFLLLKEAWSRSLPVAAPLVAAALLLSTSVSQWGRMPWSFWFNPRLPPLAQRPDQLVFLRDPVLSFAAPFFPPDSAFVGVAFELGPATVEAIRARVETHGGPFLLLQDPGSYDDTRVRRFGLAIDGPCEQVQLGRGHRLLLCPLGRLRERDAPGP